MRKIWALGLMSGTSADGVDGALLQTDGLTIADVGPTHYSPYSDRLRSQILEAYGRPPGSDKELLSRAVTLHHAAVVKNLLQKTTNKVELIGFHGQTLFHKPPFTYQIGDGALLASLTDLPVVGQFRLNDVTHGGQGAPLVPVFHQALAVSLPKPLAIINIGGVANMTWIGHQEEDLLAFDTGPGNGLIDDLVRENTELSWDEEGKIAAQGRADEPLLMKWTSHPFFSQKPPKSLDRQAFQACFQEVRNLPFKDGVATLTAFTAMTLKKASQHLPKKPRLWVVAGGGSHNTTLLKMIEKYLGAPLHKASDFGWDSDALEAQAFAFLAVRSINNLPLSFPGTTGVPYPLGGGKICYP